MNSTNQIPKSKLFNELYIFSCGESYTQLSSYIPKSTSNLLPYTINNCEFYINTSTGNKYTFNTALQWWNRGIINFTDTKGSFERVE
jgi:hypothetical protein